MRNKYRVLIYVLTGMPIFCLARYISNTYDSGFFAGIVIAIIWNIYDNTIFKNDKILNQ